MLKWTQEEQKRGIVMAEKNTHANIGFEKQLWEAAKKAAYQAVFNVSSDAPTVQEGTITYIFKLK